jgi:hypothetical protein
LVLKLLAPCFAVIVFWVVLRNAWLAILAYHAQVLLWLALSRAGRPGLRASSVVWLALPAALAGPAVYLLLPYIATVPVSTWLAQHHLTGVGLWLMVPYFGLVHPPLEQLHWAPLRTRTPLAHVLFAAYHVIVLYSLLPLAYLAAVFAVLTASSLMWMQVGRRAHSLAAPIASHVLADSGIVLAAVLLSR